MSKINIHRGTFLEKEELSRMISFFDKSVFQKCLLTISESFGLVSKGSIPGEEFTVKKSSSEGAIDIIGGCVIPSKNLEPFEVPNISGFTVPNGDWWVKLSPKTTNYEEGIVQIDNSGNVSGTVNFSGIVRGQSSGVPTCVRFIKVDDNGNETPAANNKIYQVINIVDSTTIQLSSGYPFVSESGLRVVVLGSIPLGRKFTDEQQNDGLYTFDSYRISLVSVENGVIPSRSEGENIIARVTASNGRVNTVDTSYRALPSYCNYWKLFNYSPTPEPELVSFTIIATPPSAQIVINGIERDNITVVSGTTVTWEVRAENYNFQSGTRTVSSDTVLNVSLTEIVVGTTEDFTVLDSEGSSEYEPFESLFGSQNEQFQVVINE